MSDDRVFIYEGFQRPLYTSIPDDFFDVVMTELTLAETRVILYIMRRTFGFKKDCDQISISQLTSGITRKDGSRLDRGTGLTKSGVRKAVRGLLEMGLIEAVKNADGNGGSTPTSYSIRFRDEGVHRRNPQEVTGVRPGRTQALPHKKTVNQDTEEQEYSNEDSQEISVSEAELIESYIRNYAQEFNDKAPIKSSVTRAKNIWSESDVDLETFVESMYLARSRTQKYTSSIRGGKPGQRHKMPYFFSVLTDVLAKNPEES